MHGFGSRLSLAHVAAAVALCVLPAPGAAAPATLNADEATVRLMADAPAADGMLRGAVMIELKPGWKTYWIDPGEAGLPPRLDFSGAAGPARPMLAFPAPTRFREGDLTSVGYDSSVAIGFEFSEADSQRILAGERLDLSLFVGVCRTVCVPFAADLSLDLDDLPPAGSLALLQWSRLLLPSEEALPAELSLDSEKGSLGVVLDWQEEVEEPHDLFVAAPSGWSFGPPERTPLPGNRERYDLPVLARGPGGPDALRLDLLALAGEEAVFLRQIRVDIR